MTPAQLEILYLEAARSYRSEAPTDSPADPAPSAPNGTGEDLLAMSRMRR